MKMKIFPEPSGTKVSTLKELKISEIPRQISGLKNDGTEDKRFAKGNTIVEMIKSMSKTSGKGG